MPEKQTAGPLFFYGQLDSWKKKIRGCGHQKPIGLWHQGGLCQTCDEDGLRWSPRWRAGLSRFLGDNFARVETAGIGWHRATRGKRGTVWELCCSYVIISSRLGLLALSLPIWFVGAQISHSLNVLPGISTWLPRTSLRKLCHFLPCLILKRLNLIYCYVSFGWKTKKAIMLLLFLQQHYYYYCIITIEYSGFLSKVFANLFAKVHHTLPAGR